jgi:predicted DNA-binding protein (MmcQ/YjbR family)
MAARPSPTSQRERVLPLPLTFPGAVLTNPFGDDVNVYKVGVQAASGAAGRHAGGKMFCLISLRGDPGTMTVKVAPEHVAGLVRGHAAIEPGYHMNKRHWVSVTLDGTLDDAFLRELVEDSYDLTLSTLTARARFDVDPDRFPLPPVRSRAAAPSRPCRPPRDTPSP